MWCLFKYHVIFRLYDPLTNQKRKHKVIYNQTNLKTVQVHHLSPGLYKILHKLVLGVGASI